MQSFTLSLRVFSYVRTYPRHGRPYALYGEQTHNKVKGAVREIQRRSGLLYRTGVGFIVCKRARVVALLHLWPEGEAGVKFEMRTGKRVRCAKK